MPDGAQVCKEDLKPVPSVFTYLGLMALGPGPGSTEQIPSLVRCLLWLTAEEPEL